MPTIYDNINGDDLAHALNNTLYGAKRADFCIGYFNLRGWKLLADCVEQLSGAQLADDFDDDATYYSRVLIGMQKQPLEELEECFSPNASMDNATANEKKKEIVAEFAKQLQIGYPTSGDEATIKKLSKQLQSGKVAVKLHLSFQLHAKLYLAYIDNYNTPLVGYLGSSNLTFAGLSKQGELNVDVTDSLAAKQLEKWYQDRWDDRYSIDITKELVQIIEQSWAQEKLLSPYHIYMKIVYHLSQEARAGISEFSVPKIFKNKLLPFQQNAVQVAAHHLHKRGGVIIGDVVGLGKTITATALAKMFEDDFFLETLIICPANLVEMWQGYVRQYGLRAKVISISSVQNILPNEKRFRLMIIDESHNLRNKEGRHYRAISEYIALNDSKVIMLTATPYNKSYLDLSNQLRLFIPEEQNLGITPERYIEALGGKVQFEAQHQVRYNSIAAFEKSDFSDDWAELMRLFLVRRTRSFIKTNYAKKDTDNDRLYLEFAGGEKDAPAQRSYFPDRIPSKVEYAFDKNDPNDQYARLYSDDVVGAINLLSLPRYGLGKDKYINQQTIKTITADEEKIKQNLSKAGSQLVGFARSNLFKRLESSGYSFLLSLSRHILRNYLFIYAIENDVSFPVGKQENDLIRDMLYTDNDLEARDEDTANIFITDTNEYIKRAKDYYQTLLKKEKKYNWIRSSLFNKKLKDDLLNDCASLMKILEKSKRWNEDCDRQLGALYDLIANKHASEKVLVFTQYSDTAFYLYEALKKRGIKDIDCATGDLENPTLLAHRFSPISNEAKTNDELRVLISTDVLSEGQNLQDCHIVVNYDLPWAIIRLIQRAGRVDRIGQQSDKIYCYSFLPEDGIETIINLRGRLRQRIEENAKTVGSDEVFFDGDPVNIADLYNEKSGILDDDEDTEVDLASFCYQIWKNGCKAHPELKEIIPAMNDVVYATKKSDYIKASSFGELAANMGGTLEEKGETGVIIYTRTSDDNDSLILVDEKGKIITGSQYEILKALKCSDTEKPLPRLENHHDLVVKGIAHIRETANKLGGQLGKKSGARYRAYMRLDTYLINNSGGLFVTDEMKRTHEDIYNYPLREYAREVLLRELKAGIDDQALVDLLLSLHEQGLLSVKDNKEYVSKEPHIICSMGLR